MAKACADSWGVTDEFWRRVEPLIPQAVRDPNRQYLRGEGAGRPPKPPRLVFDAIVYVLRSGCQWRALLQERFGSPTAVHQKFTQWSKAGFFDALWEAGLAECDDLEGIAWRWRIVQDKLPPAGEGMSTLESQLSTFLTTKSWEPLVTRRESRQRL